MSILIGLVVLVAVEIGALVAVADRIGVFPAVGLLVLVSACGPWLVRRAGFGVLRRARARLGGGGTLEREALDGVLLLAAGLLICVPGFVTDAAGVLLLLPPVRAAVGRRIRRRAAGSLILRFGGLARPGRAVPGRWGGGPADDGTVLDAQSHLAAPPADDRSGGPGGYRPEPGSEADQDTTASGRLPGHTPRGRNPGE